MQKIIKNIYVQSILQVNIGGINTMKLLIEKKEWEKGIIISMPKTIKT